jgi:hypothetical protein
MKLGGIQIMKREVLSSDSNVDQSPPETPGLKRRSKLGGGALSKPKVKVDVSNKFSDVLLEKRGLCTDTNKHEGKNQSSDGFDSPINDPESSDDGINLLDKESDALVPGNFIKANSTTMVKSISGTGSKSLILTSGALKSRFGKILSNQVSNVSEIDVPTSDDQSFAAKI